MIGPTPDWIGGATAEQQRRNGTQKRYGRGYSVVETLAKSNAGKNQLEYSTESENSKAKTHTRISQKGRAKGKFGPDIACCHYRGVRQRKWGKWVAEIGNPHISKKKVWLGSYSTELEAARAYDKAASMIYGSSAHLNLPEGVRSSTMESTGGPTSGSYESTATTLESNDSSSGKHRHSSNLSLVRQQVKDPKAEAENLGGRGPRANVVKLEHEDEISSVNVVKLEHPCGHDRQVKDFREYLLSVDEMLQLMDYYPGLEELWI